MPPHAPRPAAAFSCLTRCWFGLLIVASAPPAAADIGPENVVVVVNGDSVASRLVANRYVAARGIAEIAVITLHDLPDWETTNVELFREKILKPTLAAANERGLAAQLDAVVYSTAIPTKIDVRADLKDLDPKPSKYLTPYGSLTGLTYLYESVLAKRPQEYLSPSSNLAFATPEKAEDGTVGAPISRGFRRQIGFDEKREPTTGPGRRYLLSAVLGVTTGRGEAVEEIAARIDAVAAADGTNPAGVVAFTKTGDVRSKTRKPLFDPAVASIAAVAEERGLDVRGEIVVGSLPKRRPALVGATLGLPGVSEVGWRGARSGFAPGGFADNLTSFGAVLNKKHGQVTAVDWLRFGAAASGGTVHEPYALAFKFPSPFVHLHRLRGLTLGEAVARSLASPYQYLTVGDPLSNPYAARPTVTLGLPKSAPTEPLSGVVPIWLRAKGPAGAEAELARWEFFADGVRLGESPPKPVSGWNTAALPEGASVFTAVAVSADEAAGRGRVRRVVSVNNDEGSPTILFTTPSPEVVWGETLPIRVETVGQSGPVRLSIRRGAEELLTETVEADGVRTFELDTRTVGVGQITLRAFLVSSEAVAAEGEDSTRPAGVRSAPLSVEITPPAERAPSVSENAALLWGPALR
ncbi:MAG: TIGR03790 family protein, partial [Planctomycetota bacterium]